MKKIILLLPLILIAVFVKAQTPTAKCITPQTIKAGETFNVVVKISKCDLAVYAQYQQKLPDGFTAKEISGKSDNANFYFENGKVLYQWYKLPVDRDSITLEYSVTPANNTATGKYSLPGYFSYQVNNKLGYAQSDAEIEIK